MVVKVNAVFDCVYLGRWSRLGGTKVYQRFDLIEASQFQWERRKYEAGCCFLKKKERRKRKWRDWLFLFKNFSCLESFNNIYIYCHPQTDCFVLSELFSVARHAGCSKPGSKPVQLYVRLSFGPVGHQADYAGWRNFKVFYF